MVRAVSRGNALFFFGLGGGDKEFSKLDTVPSRKPSVRMPLRRSLSKKVQSLLERVTTDFETFVPPPFEKTTLLIPT